jgi:hypothetical protein
LVTVSRAGATRSRLIRSAVVLAACGLAWASPARAVSLPGGYDPTIADNTSGTTADRFGASFVNAGDISVPKDGKDDLIVGVPDAPDPGGLPGISGKVVFIDGSTGGTLGTVRTPSGDAAISHVGAPTAMGASVATLGDIGSCPSGCSAIGPPDGYPEHLASAPGSDISSTALDMGIVYVLDGKTFQVMKRIELAPDARPSASPGFGKAVAALADANDGGKPDLVIGAPGYEETAESDPAGCAAPDPSTCPNLGRVYIVHGEDITGSAGSVLDTSSESTIKIQYFDKTTASQQPQLGAALAPLGDVGACAVPDGFPALDAFCPNAPPNAPSNVPDGYPDFLVTAPGLDVSGNTDAGKAFIVDGKRGLVFGAISSPDPQQDAGFGSVVAGTASGDLAGGPQPDIYLSAPGQDLGAVDQGRAYVLNGDVTSPFLLQAFDDPLPATGARFGTGIAALGDVAGDAPGEVAAGRGDGGGPVEILSPCKGVVLQTIPDQDPGSGFGSAIAPMDANLDGYLDVAIGAPGYAGGKGRIYLMKSNGAPGPTFDGCNPAPPGGGGATGTGTGTTGSGSTPPRSKVHALAKRTIRLTGTKKKIGIGKLVTLKGRLTARTRKSKCQVRQKVAIERFELAGFYLTIDVAVTRRDGSFATSTRPSRTTIYRARVTQTKRCMSATSKKVKIRAQGV